MKYLKLKLLTLISLITFTSFAADFSNSSCSFKGEWVQISTNSFSVDIDYSDSLFKTISSKSGTAPDSLIKYIQTYNAFRIQDPLSRLRFAKDLWVNNEITNKNEVSGIVLTINSVLSGKIGKLRNVSCIEWGFFQKGAEVQKFNLSIPLYLEISGSIWKKNNKIKIILELGEMNYVTSDLKYFDKLFTDGWKQVFDIHNHPALHKHPTYNGSDLGPNLFPSHADTRYWDGTLKWGNERAVITDGITSLEVSAEEFESFHQQYFCSKYPEQYDCK